MSRLCALFIFARIKYMIGIAKVLYFLRTMTIYELLSLNKDSLRYLSAAGIKTKDYRYVDLFRDYTKMMDEGCKTTYAVAVLAGKYGICERKVYDVLRRLQETCSVNRG